MDKNQDECTNIDDYISLVTKLNDNDQFTLAFKKIKEAGIFIDKNRKENLLWRNYDKK